MNYNTLESVRNDNWGFGRLALPVEAENQPALRIRFGSQASSVFERADIDNVRIWASQL